jgi:methionyl-tRNA synthetase
LPESAQKIWTQLGLNGNVEDSFWSDISEFGVLAGHTLGDASPLFVKVEESDIEHHKKQLGSFKK